MRNDPPLKPRETVPRGSVANGVGECNHFPNFNTQPGFKFSKITLPLKRLPNSYAYKENSGQPRPAYQQSDSSESYRTGGFGRAKPDLFNAPAEKPHVFWLAGRATDQTGREGPVSKPYRTPSTSTGSPDKLASKGSVSNRNN